MLFSRRSLAFAARFLLLALFFCRGGSSSLASLYVPNRLPFPVVHLKMPRSFFFHEGVSQALLPQLLRRRGHPSNCATCRLILMNRITSDARVISLDSILKRVDTSSLDPPRCYCSVVNCFNQLFVVFLVLKQRAKNRGGMLKLTLVQGLQCINEVWLFLKHRLVRL